MSPDSLQSRVARLDQKTTDLAEAVSAFGPMLRDQVHLQATVDGVREDVMEIKQLIKDARGEFEARIVAERRERKEADDASQRKCRELERAIRQRDENETKDRRDALRWRITTAIAVIALVATYYQLLGQ